MFKKVLRRHYRFCLTLFIWLVMGGTYFGLNYFNQFRVKYYSVGFAAEESIPLIPAFIPIYLMVYFIYLTPFFFVFDERKYERVAAAYLFVVLLLGAFFLLLPTRMEHGVFVARTGIDYLVPFLRQLDLPYNLFPSAHITLAYLATFIVASEDKVWGYFLAIASTVIAFSTLLVRQHYVLDLLAGFLIGLFAYVAFVEPRRSRRR